MKCIWCQKQIYPEVTWSSLFFPKKPIPLCDTCQAGLQQIENVDCLDCGRQYNEKALDGYIRCHDCEQRHHNNKHFLLKNRSVFQYNESIQAMITKWKYRGDYCLIEAFRESIQSGFQAYFADLDKGAITVPIPLSPQRLQERAFNQSKAMAQLLPLPVYDLLQRTHGEKQAKRSREERITSPNPFRIRRSTSQPVLLIDDIYTTGTTLHHAAEILKQAGCPIVFAYTLAR
ncbi:ComF family protein [Paraliobacillus sp. JSM ZJ581]|uniref:ComF family protein n=1 Tax=Paraliobacillus sp. JSM ZJ581 TaxID=3342118 RepID=UPI0035A89F88